jgi:hypothetical protein
MMICRMLGVFCLIGVLAGCGGSLTNPTSAGPEDEQATKDYHRQVDEQERGQKDGG